MIPGLALAIGGLLLALTGAGLWIDWYGRSRPPPQRADAVVVLGAQVMPNGALSTALLERARTGAELFKRGLAPLIIFSGGNTGGPTSEAKAALHVALDLGVPSTACLLEEGSLTTLENARRTAEILRARGLQRVVLVSDAFHLARAALLFRREGVDVQPVPSARTLDLPTRLQALFREVLSFSRLLGP